MRREQGDGGDTSLELDIIYYTPKTQWFSLYLFPKKIVKNILERKVIDFEKTHNLEIQSKIFDLLLWQIF